MSEHWQKHKIQKHDKIWFEMTKINIWWANEEKIMFYWILYL